MIRRILKVLVCALCIALSGANVNGGGTSAIVNIKYIHSLIEQEWGIKLPYNAGLKNPSAAANMRYVLAAIDATNSRIGTQTSYRTSEYATGMAANVNTAIRAVRTLIKPKYHFTATTTSDTTTFSFTISASGAFYINWGDGTAMQKVIKPATGAQTISHTYATAGAYDIGIGGRATGYNGNAAVSFKSNLNLAGINGSLGQIFRNVGTNMPLFWETFRYCTNLRGSIPAELFNGVTGPPRTRMFDGTFDSCRGLTGSIPENLFAGIKGAPAYFTFSYTFYGCTGLTGEIPGKLFSGISGAPSVGTFEHTFYNCSGLTGPIPSGLFSGIRGAPAANMFGATFALCRGLTGEIPENLFAGIAGAPANRMFAITFMKCSGLTGSIPAKLFGNIFGSPATEMFAWTFADCSGLSGEIPAGLFAGISGTPASGMFNQTFRECKGLTKIPDSLFGNLSGSPAAEMFRYTFGGDSGLTGEIPPGLFGNLSGTPASNMFYGTFNACGKLTGPSARNPDGTPLYEVFPTATTSNVNAMYRGVTGLSDYADIPAAWK